MSLSDKSIEAHIKRLTKEIAEIEEDLYGFKGQSRLGVMALLEAKRDSVVRAAVLQLHTQIEECLSKIMLYCVLGITTKKLKHRLRGHKARAFRKMLFGNRSIGFDAKISMASGLGLISEKLADKLVELNVLRNKCSHSWQLRKVIRAGKKPKAKKPPFLQFRGRDLHKAAVLKELIDEYTVIYLRLYVRWTQ